MRQHISLTQATRQSFGKGLEQFVPNLMPHGVIDSLEVIEIKEQDCQFLQVTTRLSCSPGQVVLEHLAVRQPCQAVMISHVAHLFMEVIQVLSHIPEGLGQIADFVVCVHVDRHQYMATAYFASGMAELLDGPDK